jgi:hypothetical protein
MIWVMMSPLFLAVTLVAVVPVLVGIIHDDRARQAADGNAGHFFVGSPKGCPAPVSVVAVEAEVPTLEVKRPVGHDRDAALPALIS